MTTQGKHLEQEQHKNFISFMYEEFLPMNSNKKKTSLEKRGAKYINRSFSEENYRQSKIH